MNLKQQLDYLFNPRSAAVIEASNIFGKWGFNIGKMKQSYHEPYSTPEKAAKVLAHLVRYGEYLGIAGRK
jgi:acyl-CoA synthetase (NDP forming)